MLRACGASSTPRPFGSITDVSGILVHPPSRVMTVRAAATVSRSRRMFCARLILNFPPSEDQRAQGMPGARCARSLACKSESSTHASRHGHTGNTRHSPRNGLRLISRSPRGPGSFAPVVRGSLRDLNASVGAPGPHDFAVRFKRARLTAPSASTATRPTSVTIAKRPSW